MSLLGYAVICLFVFILGYASANDDDSNEIY